MGKGVLEAVNAVNGEIAENLIGEKVTDQIGLDRAMIELDGTSNRPPGRQRHPGRLAGRGQGRRRGQRPAALPLCRRHGRACCRCYDNIINGGEHAGQPDRHPGNDHAGFGGEHPRRRAHGLRGVPHAEEGTVGGGLATGVGDEGGFAPNLSSTRDALDFILKAIEKARYAPGDDIMLALDCASTEYFKGGKYEMAGRGQVPGRLRKRRLPGSALQRLSDPVDRGRLLGRRLGRLEAADRNAGRPRAAGRRRPLRDQPRAPGRGHAGGCANSLLVKVNQIGTLTETLDAVRMAGPRPLYQRDVAPPGRDRGRHHRRPRGGDELRPDQDRLAGPLGPAGEIQPADPHRGNARHPPSMPDVDPAAKRQAQGWKGRPRPPCPVAPPAMVSENAPSARRRRNRMGQAARPRPRIPFGAALSTGSTPARKQRRCQPARHRAVLGLRLDSRPRARLARSSRTCGDGSHSSAIQPLQGRHAASHAARPSPSACAATTCATSAFLRLPNTQ